MLHISLHLKWVRENQVNGPGSRNYKSRIPDSRQLFLEQLKVAHPVIEQSHSCSTDLHFFQSTTSRFLELRSSLVSLGIFAINGGLFFVASWQFVVVVVAAHCSPQKPMNFTGHFPESSNNIFAVLPIGMYTTKLFTF